MNTEPKKTDAVSLLAGLKDKLPGRALAFVTRNWPWKLLALFLAVCLWAGLIMQDPTLTRERVFTDVPLNVINADTLRRNSGLVVVSGLENGVTVRLRADVPQREYNTVTAANYNPRVDLSRITDVGEQVLKVSSTSTTTYGSVIDISPATVSVVVDEYITNYRVPVSVNISGSYPEGFYGSSISVDPSVVAVSGPKMYVDQVARVIVDFDVSRLSARAGEVRTARAMRFVDRAGKDVDSSMLEVTSADVVLRTIILEQTLYPTVEIPLNAQSMIEGSPAGGYYVKNVKVSPSVLTAAGDQDALDSLDVLAAYTPVNIKDADASLTETVRIRKPAEVEHLSADTVTVTVEIEPVTISRTFENAKLSVRGTGSGLKATSEKKYASMVLTGPQPLLETLRTNAVTSYVDVSGLEAGEYVLPVQLHVEGMDLSGVSWIATPATVRITLADD